MEPCGNVTTMFSSRSTLATDGQVTTPDILPTWTSDESRQSNSVAMPRSASYDHISSGAIPNIPFKPHGVKRTLSENALASLQGGTSRQPFEPEKLDTIDRGVGTHSSARSDNKPKITISKYTLAAQYDGNATYAREPEKSSSSSGSSQKSRSVSGSLSNFAKKSWSTASRSPSPRKRSTLLEETTLSKTRSDHVRPSPSLPANKPIQNGRKPPNGSTYGLMRHDSTVGKKPRRPLSAFLGKAPAEPKVPLVPSIPKSFSSDRLPAISQTHSSSETPPTIPKSISSDRLQHLGVDSLRKRDELWGAFRALDGEFHKFQSRPNISKTGVVRSALLPFLRNYAEHPSNTLLRPEELDRRIQVLNRWWTGLLEMLNGRNGESVSGNDRPAILEATTAIMIRPEWDLPPSTIMARSSKSLRPSLKSRSTTSLGSTASEFLADSVFHNIKNTFSQNLLAQMAYVVDKMSTRSVPASVVTFCGKAVAYAFFYCDGVADILVRLWATTSETLRRVLAESGIRRDTIVTSASERVVIRFPPCLHALSFKSLQSMMRYLRSQPQVPVATGCIPWNGSWVGRWAGKDTDLFFVFTKSYYSLAARLLPEDHSQEERMCAPGYALLQAQILKILDATMQHPSSQPSLDQFKESSSLMTFDDILGETDASAALLPISTRGVIRSMAENRLIMLLRDCLSGSFSVTEKGRGIFAESFQILLKAATRRISLFDHNGCFTLCDFMEEAIVIIARYKQVTHSLNSTLDWSFWFDVWRMLMESQNTMTEIRLFAFLYSLWGTITCDESRKREICLGWLLQDEVFERQFNHWCPMVRAYFMRLLCWRVARVEDKGSELDRSVLETLQIRLERQWCHYLYLKEFSEREGLLAPSTIPCSPAPGRRLLIVRDDVQAPSSGMFLSFDSILSPQSSSTQSTAYERHSSLRSVSQTAPLLSRASDGTSRPTSGGKRRWGLFKNIMNFTSATTDRPQTDLAPQNPLAGKETFSNELGEVAKSDRNNKKAFSTSSQPSELNNPYRSHSFKFSLEWIDKENNYVENERQLQPPKLPIAAQKILPVLRSDPRKYEPCMPVGPAVGASKYAGRAFAEWSDIITECQSFFERRRNEGVPTSSKVETPTLGVESFRKLG